MNVSERPAVIKPKEVLFMRRKMRSMGIGVMLSLVFFAVPSLIHAADVITIKAATMHPAKHRLTDDSFSLYGKEVEKRTNGRVEFKWYLAGSLVNWGQSQQAVKTGLVDMVLVLPQWLHLPEYPVTRAMSLPFMGDSAAHAALTLYKMYQTIPEMREEYAHIKPLAFFSTAISNLHTMGPAPKTMEDLKGMRIWCASKVSVELVKCLGSSSRQTKLQDVYMAMQRGMADGLLFPNAPMRSFKLIELISNHTMGDFYVAPHIYAMNLKKWQSLPPDIQKVFEDLTLSAGCQAGATLTNESEWVIQELKKRGDKFHYLPPEEKARWRQAAQPMFDEWIADLNSRGWNGQAIYEKIMALSEEARKSPYKADDWWGRTGRME
jgi:TRAP-type C4-dicarboxylate transport system substrate-binding protein